MKRTAIQTPDPWEKFSSLLTDARRAKLMQVAAQRTRHITLVLQDVHQPHNISACLRSAEALGVQDIHVITAGESFKPSTVARGVSSWLTITKWEDVKTCSAALRKAGYLLCGAFPPSEKTVSLTDIQVTRPLAIIFGNEHEGLSSSWQEEIDQHFTIPMVGFVESFNISVAAAISLHTMTAKSRRELPAEKYYISPDAQRTLLNEWISQHKFARTER